MSLRLAFRDFGASRMHRWRFDASAPVNDGHFFACSSCMTSSSDARCEVEVSEVPHIFFKETFKKQTGRLSHVFVLQAIPPIQVWCESCDQPPLLDLLFIQSFLQQNEWSQKTLSSTKKSTGQEKKKNTSPPPPHPGKNISNKLRVVFLLFSGFPSIIDRPIFGFQPFGISGKIQLLPSSSHGCFHKYGVPQNRWWK